MDGEREQLRALPRGLDYSSIMSNGVKQVPDLVDINDWIECNAPAWSTLALSRVDGYLRFIFMMLNVIYNRLLRIIITKKFMESLNCVIM